MKRKKQSVIAYKLLYTVGIVILYLVGRNIALYGIDTSAYIYFKIDEQSILYQAVNGDLTQTSVFALGFSAYIFASMLSQLICSIKNSDGKSRMSQKKANLYMLFLMMLAGVVQALIRAKSLRYRVTGSELWLARGIVVLELLTGMLILLYLCDRNSKYGFGGRSILIFINVVDGLMTTLYRVKGSRNLYVAAGVSLLVLVLMILMENTEKRIPLQRVSIHNIHADKNYLAIKLNPVGVMPIMFATVAYTVPKLIIGLMAVLFPKNKMISWCDQNLVMEKTFGMSVYMVGLLLLTLGFAWIMISPKNLTENFLKSGDSIHNVHAGRETYRYLSRTIWRISLISWMVMCICVILPIWLQKHLGIEQTVSVLPAAIMILTGIWSSLYQEYIALRQYDTYKPFV